MRCCHTFSFTTSLTRSLRELDIIDFSENGIFLRLDSHVQQPTSDLVVLDAADHRSDSILCCLITPCFGQYLQVARDSGLVLVGHFCEFTNKHSVFKRYATMLNLVPSPRALKNFASLIT